MDSYLIFIEVLKYTIATIATLSAFVSGLFLMFITISKMVNEKLTKKFNWSGYLPSLMVTILITSILLLLLILISC